MCVGGATLQERPHRGAPWLPRLPEGSPQRVAKVEFVPLIDNVHSRGTVAVGNGTMCQYRRFTVLGSTPYHAVEWAVGGTPLAHYLLQHVRIAGVSHS